MHSYAPADLTPAEMFRFVSDLRSEEFVGAHPILQASYAHYALVVIHPFADGNGRVARALSSVFMYRARSIPLLIFADQKAAYLASLEAADRGEPQHFVEFISERTFDTIQLVEENIKGALAPPAEESLARIQRLYVTKGGFSQEEVDKAGTALLDAFASELRREVKEVVLLPQIRSDVVLEATHLEGNANFRSLFGRTNRLSLKLSTKVPALSAYVRYVDLLVPRDCGREDDLLLVCSGTDDQFSASVSEVAPIFSATLQIRLRMFSERFVAEALSQLAQKVGYASKH
jgi:Fic/DOC family